MPNLPLSHGGNSAKKHKLPEQERSSNAMGYDYRWQKFRLSFLKKNPLCVECLKSDRTTPANEVDHIIPHRGDKELFWRIGNHQSLCKPCHSAKTARGL